MTECCTNNSLIVYRGSNNTRFLDCDWLNIKFQTQFDLTNFSAKFKLGIAERTWDTLSEGITINLNEQEIEALSVGMNYATLVVWDNEGNSKPFSTAIPVMVRDWVDGQYQKLDTFHMSVNAKFEGETVMTITIETAKVSEQMVDDKIAEHNSDETAHQFIQQILTIESTARADADNQLQSNIDTKQAKLTSANAGNNISITEVDGIVKINSTAGGVTVHNQLTGRDAENSHPMSSITGLTTALSGKQQTISDLDDIRSNASAGKSASNTIATYGNIVTHNTSEFATAEQGEKADSAVQLEVMNSAISVHNTSDLSHEDIRAVADEALTRASDKAISKVFDTTAEMETWLKDPTNKGVLKVGDNIYIIDPSVPDYWVSAVYETADPTTGYYYRINQLSSEVPDITNMVTTNTAQTITGNKNFTGALQKNGANVLVSTDIEEYTSTEIETLWSSL